MDLIAEGLEFPEGPVAMHDGSIILVEIKGKRLTRICPDGSFEKIADVPGGPNGAAMGPDGAIYICNNGGRFEFVDVAGVCQPSAELSPNYIGGSIQRVDLSTGDITTLYTDYRGQRLRAPNDLVFDRSGGIWFTDHGLTRGDTLEYGAIFYAAADGSSINRVRKHLISPNGIALSPDESVLYVADTLTARLHACKIEGPGVLAKSSVPMGPIVATLPGHQALDSMAVESTGNICVGTLYNGGISIFAPDGSMDHVAFPDPFTTNICFGGADMRDAWVTCSGTGKLYKRRWPIAGLSLNFTR